MESDPKRFSQFLFFATLMTLAIPYLVFPNILSIQAKQQILYLPWQLTLIAFCVVSAAIYSGLFLLLLRVSERWKRTILFFLLAFSSTILAGMIASIANTATR